MSTIFEVTDPRGYRIVCTESAWEHIIGSHASLMGQEAKVKQTIQQPTMGIYQDARFADRQVYYRFAGEFYLKVVIQVTGTKSGTVVTAYLTDSGKQGEKLLWPISKS